MNKAAHCAVLRLEKIKKRRSSRSMMISLFSDYNEDGCSDDVRCGRLQRPYNCNTEDASTQLTPSSKMTAACLRLLVLV